MDFRSEKHWDPCLCIFGTYHFALSWCEKPMSKDKNLFSGPKNRAQCVGTKWDNRQLEVAFCIFTQLDLIKDLQAFGVALVRRMTAATAATAAITLACLFVEMLSYVLWRLYSSCVLSNKIGLHRWKLVNKTLVNNDFSKENLNFLFIYIKSDKFSKF